MSTALYDGVRAQLNICYVIKKPLINTSGKYIVKIFITAVTSLELSAEIY